VVLCRTECWLPCVGQGRLLGKLAFVRLVCVPAHVHDLQRWLVRVVVPSGLSVWKPSKQALNNEINIDLTHCYKIKIEAKKSTFAVF
jgi:hypothetical protein